MVSGLVTSPCDHCRIFSGDASEIRIASKSGASCVFSCWNRNTLISPFISIHRLHRFNLRNLWLTVLSLHGARYNRFTNTILCSAVFSGLLVDQLDVETERLQFTDEHVERLRQTWIEIGRASCRER